MPDRGALLAYDRARPVLVRGAETFHAVDLSEAHALNAMAPGRSLELQTPSGETMRFDYQRSERNLDGNWSWAGRSADGLQALITFGDKAVFGQIDQRNAFPLRLATLEGHAYMVQTDPAKLTIPHGPDGKPQDDVLIPPHDLVAAVQRKARAAPAAANNVPAPGLPAVGAPASKTTAAVTATAAPSGPVVDVLLGYTSGLRAKLGGTSQTNTRLSYLISVANQSLANSAVSGRVRLVRTMEVNYDNAGANSVALDELTGNNVVVPAALQPLRAAREQSGADLVSLVRPTIVSTNCGLGWLVGANGEAITKSRYAPYAYSVINDGSILDGSGRTLLCYENSLAHEMGHNMGQQHNVEDSMGFGPGAHPYSYGYREASASGFFTVMAYPFASGGQAQTPIFYFSNPNVLYQGRPTGTATADNARSLNQTMPLIAQFRTASATPYDFNGDGNSDLVWRNGSQMAFWWMNGPSLLDYFVTGDPVGYRIVGNGDFDGDRIADILWQGPGGDLWLWLSTGSNFTGAYVGQTPAGWTPLGVGDINGDGLSDIIWRYDSTGMVAVWLMNGATISLGNVVTPNAFGYRLIAAKDTDGDGRADLIWANDTTAQLWVWTTYTAMNRSQEFSPGFVGSIPAGWTVFGAGDVDADGRSDLLWRSPSSGTVAYWTMNGAAVMGARLVSPLAVSAYWPVSIGDFNGDGRADITWTSGALDLWMWTSNGSDFDGALVANYPAGWVPTP